MNKNVLQKAAFSAIMQIYSSLYDEYNDEKKAKMQTYKMFSSTLRDFGAISDIAYTINVLISDYKTEKNELIRNKLYKDIEVLENALEIIKEVNTIDY